MRYVFLFLSFFLLTVTSSAQSRSRRHSSSATDKNAHKSQGSNIVRGDGGFHSEITYPDAESSVKEQHYGGTGDMREEPKEKTKDQVQSGSTPSEKRAKPTEKKQQYSTPKEKKNDKDKQGSKSRQSEQEHHGNEVEQDGSVWM